jgi:hypothetical protein
MRRFSWEMDNGESGRVPDAYCTDWYTARAWADAHLPRCTVVWEY